MDKLLFLYNELLNPELRYEMRIPTQFIGFGFVEGKLYHHYNKRSTFILPIDVNKKWGNSVVYGALFLVKDFDFYSRILDSYHICSLSMLRRNHVKDLHHRINIEVTPIFFKSLQDLAGIKYREGEPITAQTYIGNLNHPKINKRLKQANQTASYRIVDGIDKVNFKKLFWEVAHERRINT